MLRLYPRADAARDEEPPSRVRLPNPTRHVSPIITKGGIPIASGTLAGLSVPFAQHAFRLVQLARGICP